MAGVSLHTFGGRHVRFLSPEKIGALRHSKDGPWRSPRQEPPQGTDMMLPPTALRSVSWLLLSCLALLSQVQGEDSQDKEASPRISCPKGSKAYGGYCYALFTITKSWMDADLACQKRPAGHLASVLSGTEAAFVASLVKSSGGNSYSNVWIGLHDPTEGSEPGAGGWEWSTSDVLNYQAWEKDPATISSPGYCGSLTRVTGYLKWNDYGCYTKLPYVCKFTG
ncbi:Regenerating islet-derived protein 3-gamma [Manis javanica]|nr:Regenerating islet-derived protein 3-gamma [Manis javanica]